MRLQITFELTIDDDADGLPVQRAITEATRSLLPWLARSRASMALTPVRARPCAVEVVEVRETGT